MNLEPGNVVLGQYKIIRFLGEGGMGKTYLAEEMRLQRLCVLKTALRAELNPEDLQRMDHEARIMADLHHPHLPVIYRYDFVGERPYIVMEYIPGPTLDKKSGITVAQAQQWLGELLDTLNHLHQKGIIHRDIHPRNICINEESNKAFLLDFGLARRLEASRTELFLMGRHRDYAPIEQNPPERLRAESLPQAAKYVQELRQAGYHTRPYTDIYALAATFYFALTKRHPTNPCARVVGEVLEPPQAVNPQIPDWLTAVLMKALALHPQDRYQKARDMLAALHSPSVISISEREAEQSSPPAIVEQVMVADMEFVHIPAGEFLMGSNEPELLRVRSNPRHPVRLDSYFIGRYPVTNAAYQRFIDAHPKRPVPTSPLPEAQPYCWNTKTRRYPAGLANYPVVLITWEEALAYCAWLSEISGRVIRLPNEAEWEKAAGWETTTNSCRRYPWGPEFENGRCHIGHKQLSPVGQYSPGGDSPYGLADMAGLIWQWTRSYYWPYPYNLLDRRDKEDFDGKRVSRGGAFNEPPLTAHCAWRARFAPAIRQPNLGFRLVCEKQPPPPRSRL